MFMGTRLQSAMETLFSKPRSSAPSRSPRVKVLLGIRFESLSPWKMCWPLQAEVDFRQTTELACGAGSKPVKYCLYIYAKFGDGHPFLSYLGVHQGYQGLDPYHTHPPLPPSATLWLACGAWVARLSHVDLPGVLAGKQLRSPELKRSRGRKRLDHLEICGKYHRSTLLLATFRSFFGVMGYFDFTINSINNWYSHGFHGFLCFSSSFRAKAHETGSKHSRPLIIITYYYGVEKWWSQGIVPQEICGSTVRQLDPKDLEGSLSLCSGPSWRLLDDPSVWPPLLGGGICVCSWVSGDLGFPPFFFKALDPMGRWAPAQLVIAKETTA